MKGVLADSQVNGQSNFSPHAHVENILKLARRLPETQRCQKYPQPRDDRSGMNDPFLGSSRDLVGDFRSQVQATAEEQDAQPVVLESPEPSRCRFDRLDLTVEPFRCAVGDPMTKVRQQP